MSFCVLHFGFGEKGCDYTVNRMHRSLVCLFGLLSVKGFLLTHSRVGGLDECTIREDTKLGSVYDGFWIFHDCSRGQLLHNTLIIRITSRSDSLKSI